MILEATKSNIAQSAKALLEGEVIGFPTETVYGLGARIDRPEAIQKIFDLKGRPKTDPLIVHIHSVDQLKDFVEEIPGSAQKLMREFWPGPLTIILKKKNSLSDEITAGLSSVAVRMPKHPVAIELLKSVEAPIAAPSANKFQSLSPTSAKAVEQELGEGILVLDGGNSEVGLESTVISMVEVPTVLRLGGVTLENLTESLGEPPLVVRKASSEKESLSSPGQLDFHYAPKTPLQLFDRVEDMDSLKPTEKMLNYALVFSQVERDLLLKKGFSRIKVLSPKGNLAEAGKALFSTLREIDKDRPQKILALKVPDRGLGKAINDRLTKAQHGPR